MFKKLTVIGLATMLTFSGCTTPLTEADIQERKERSAKFENLAHSKLKPLLPICLNAFETGALPTDQAMARHGYSPNTGLSFWPGANYKTTGVKSSSADLAAFHSKKCNFALNGVLDPNAGYAAMGDLIKEGGYQFSRASGQRIFYRKGNIEVIVVGLIQQGSVWLSLTKR